MLVKVQRAQEKVKRLQREMEIALIELRDVKREYYAHEIASTTGFDESNAEVRIVAGALEMWGGDWSKILKDETGKDVVDLWEMAIRDGKMDDARSFSRNLTNLIAYGKLDV